MTFILCTTDIDGIPQRARSLFRLLEVGPVAVSSRLELLRKICDKEGFAHSESALDLFVRRAGGHLRQMIQDLEGLAEQGTITLEQVRTSMKPTGLARSAYTSRGYWTTQVWSGSCRLSMPGMHCRSRSYLVSKRISQNSLARRCSGSGAEA